jgi:hypothetical protein
LKRSRRVGEGGPGQGIWGSRGALTGPRQGIDIESAGRPLRRGHAGDR